MIKPKQRCSSGITILSWVVGGEGVVSSCLDAKWSLLLCKWRHELVHCYSSYYTTKKYTECAMTPILAWSMMSKRTGRLFFKYCFLSPIVCCILVDCKGHSQFAIFNCSSIKISTFVSTHCWYDVIKLITISICHSFIWPSVSFVPIRHHPAPFWPPSWYNIFPASVLHKPPPPPAPSESGCVNELHAA